MPLHRLDHLVRGRRRAQVLHVPDAIVRYSATTTSATTTFDTAHQTWVSVVPAGFDKPVFLTGLAYRATTGLPGGIKQVEWWGQLSADGADVKAKWQWAADTHRPAAMGRPVHGPRASALPAHVREALSTRAKGGDLRASADAPQSRWTDAAKRWGPT